MFSRRDLLAAAAGLLVPVSLHATQRSGNKLRKQDLKVVTLSISGMT